MTRPSLRFTLAALTAVAVTVAAAAPGAATAGARGAPGASGTGGAAAAPAALVGLAAGSGVRVRASPPPRRSAAQHRWRWPLLPRPPVLRPFRAPLSEYGRGHRGLDLVAEAGAPVLAVDDGVVTHAGVVAGRGTVSVRHADGLSSTYEPVSPAVAVGSVLSVGDRVGTVDARAGSAHCGARACLHLGARRGDGYIDPYSLLSSGRVRLLPLR